jgi:ribonuclease BN (tRNA processing enzyme)
MKKLITTILGSGTCVPSLERSSCSVLLKGESTHLLVDAGPGTMGQLIKLGVHINDIDMILLSHFHLDHCAELAPFLFATKYPGFNRKKPLTLVGGTGLAALLEQLNRAYDHTLDLPENMLQVMELDESGSADLGFEEIRLDYTAVKHKPESRAFRFTDQTGFSTVYSGDTDECPQLVDLARGADLLICESALPDDQKAPGHLTPSLAGAIAARAGVGKLVLTHFYPECDGVDIKAQCRLTFDGPLILAEDLLTCL